MDFEEKKEVTKLVEVKDDQVNKSLKKKSGNKGKGMTTMSLDQFQVPQVFTLLLKSNTIKINLFFIDRLHLKRLLFIIMEPMGRLLKMNISLSKLLMKLNKLQRKRETELRWQRKMLKKLKK